MEIDKMTLPATSPQADAPSSPAPAGDNKALLNLLRIKPFRNVWIGATISQLGDVCFMVALPWLILQMTGSSLALGAVMTALALPRALLLLVGGAISDRVPARTILAVAFLVQSLCVAAVAALVFYDILNIELLIALTLCFGLADAFTAPTMHVLLPQLVNPYDLPGANAMIESTNQLCLLVGAALVGFMIAEWGILFAFVADALSYVLLIFVMLNLTPGPRPEVAPQSMKSAIIEGLRYVWRESDLRALFIAIACVNFCIAGVTQVGFAALASFKFGSPTAFGFLMVCISIGSLLGIVWAGTPA